MNETEKDRILRMVSDGTLKPNEAAQLLSALSDEPQKASKRVVEVKSEEKPKPQEPLMEVQMQRPDGSTYTIQVPPNLFPMFWKIAKVAIRESARTASQEAWSGFKNIVRTKTEEVKTSVKTRVSGGGATKPEAAAVVVPTLTLEQERQAEARRCILQMVQNGRITAADASRLIQELDALRAYQKESRQ